jgi:hypothetical protein
LYAMLGLFCSLNGPSYTVRQFPRPVIANSSGLAAGHASLAAKENSP